MKTHAFYEHSGTVPPLGLVVALVVGLSGGSLLAAAYAYAILYIPVAGYITFLLSAGFGFLVGLVAGRGLVWGKIRNGKVAFAVGSVVALCALYVAWAVWAFALLRRSEVDADLATILASPQLLWVLLGEIADAGAWSIGGFSPTGTALWGLWALEAGLILLPAIAVSMVPMVTPFCERCGIWAEEKEDVARLAAAEPDALRAQLEERSLGALRELGPVPAAADQWIRLDLHSCPRCENLNTLSVKQVTRKTNEKGEESEDAQAIVDGLLVYSADLALIRELGSPQAAGQAASPA